MLNIDARSRTDSYSRHFASSCRVATDHSGISLRAHFQPDITIVEVYGAVDACNTERLSDYVDNVASPGRPLIVDLRGVDFFGRDCLRALLRIAENRLRTSARWTLVPSVAVDRLLHITDSNDRLPTAASLEDALQQLAPHRHARSRPQRITPPEFTRC